MDPIVTTNALGPGQTQTVRPAGEGDDRATMIASDFETFLRLLTTQLKNQDPLNPMVIPTVIDQNPCAHLRMPRDMIFHGWSMRLFQAWQHSATMSS